MYPWCTVRVDLIFILLDKPDEGHDRRISEHIMRTHSLSQQPATYLDSSSSIANRTAGGTSADRDADLTLTQRLRRSIGRLRCRPSGSSSSGGSSNSDKNGNGIHHPHSQAYSQCPPSYDEDYVRAPFLGGSSSSSSASSSTLPTEQVRRYIEYAKRYVHPTLTPAAAKVLQRLYLTMRAQSSLGQSIPVTTRHLESLIRLAQARARIDLREEVSEADAQDVVQVSETAGWYTVYHASSPCVHEY